MRPYTFNLQPFFADPNIAQQAFASSEPFQAMQKGVKANFFLLADDGYPPYTGAITTTQETVAKRPDVVARFVKATMEGWKSYLENPAPANEIIKKENPNMTDAQIAFGLQRMKEMKVVTGGEAAKNGIGAMSDERWKKTADFMVSYGLLKPATDYKKAYTLEFVKDLRVMPGRRQATQPVPTHPRTRVESEWPSGAGRRPTRSPSRVQSSRRASR